MKNIKLLILLFALFSTFKAFAGFTDVPQNSSYFDSITYSKEHNVVNGYSDGTFRPENNLTREEFIKIIVNSNYSKNKIYGEKCFTDTNGSTFEKYICTAKREGIVSGYEDGTFKPGRNIQFIEASKMIILGLGRKSEISTNGNYLRKYGYYLGDKKAIPTSIKFANSELKRGEMVEIIWRLKENITTKNSQNDYFVNYQLIGGKIYYYDKIIVGADVNTFEVLDSGYSKDKISAYDGEKSLPGVDVQTFRILEGDYSLDKNNVYYQNEKIQGADSKTFSLVDPNNKEIGASLYYKDSNNVYNERHKIEGADINTFQILKGNYSKDKNNCYYFYRIVDKAKCENQ